ncbi:rhodanese-like domain-containing protein [Blastococcus mobilis]|uniref:Rhodanese-related sulfurtransferase n=1 Tax=Blastococcus mobilis TaxID=1938746 RepID=A0A238W5X1_9ACTN|nr:rhodanese-like domain-containing protein [Blastococcus mobilis]SNR41936.1 Rhodanese-related sulfurtransferase [Blastococcus mobilis]
MRLLDRIKKALAGNKVTPREAELLRQSGAVLLDVRTRQEFKAGHAPRSRNIPLDQLAGRLREVPAHRRVITVCRSGARSARAAALLRNEGRDVVDVRGGMLAWQRAGLPLDGPPGRTHI